MSNFWRAYSEMPSMPRASFYRGGKPRGYSKAKAQRAMVKASKRRRLNKSIRSYKKSKLSRVAKRVDKLARYTASDMGTLIYRTIACDTQLSTANNCSNFSRSIGDTTSIEATLAQLKYYDPSAPTNLVTADFSTGAYHKEILFEKMSLKIKIRANYEIPLNVCVYHCSVKEDTSNSPVTIFSNGDTTISNSTSNSPFLYPSDLPLFNDLWKIEKTEKCVIQAGREKEFNIYNDKMITYDPSLTDAHSLTYQKNNGAKALFCRVWGCIAHDSVADEQGLQDVQYDFQMMRSYTLKYNAGADIKYVYVDETGLSTFTTGANVCNPVEAQNQAPSAT